VIATPITQLEFIDFASGEHKVIVLTTPGNISTSWMERAWREAAGRHIECVVDNEIQGKTPDWIVIDDIPRGILQQFLDEPLTREVIAPKRNSELQREYGTSRGSKGKRRKW
jgi:hypothetical protein